MTNPGRPRPWLGFLALLGALAPSLMAIALVPGFSTQDGPAHVYSAKILDAALGLGPDTLLGTFRVDWQPVPNWAGHALTMCAVAVASPEVANRLVAAFTLVALAGSAGFLRWSVQGTVGLATSSLLAALIGLNVTWLLGFTSFLLGSSVGACTLGYWWKVRRSGQWTSPLGLAALLTLGYFCHPISLGLTVGAIVVMTAATPGPGSARRFGRLAASFAPLVPLGLAYRSITRSGGGLEPAWDHLASIASPRAWVAQLGWVDPISLAAKTTTPFEVDLGRANVSSPALWAFAAIAWLTISTFRRPAPDRATWSWPVVGVGLILAGIVSPDTLGVKHGHYLPQRIILFGLIALTPWLDLSGRRWGDRLAIGGMAVALTLQSLFVWDYAFASRDRVVPFLAIAPKIPRGVKVGTVLSNIRGRFRSNPLLHADNLAAAASDSVFWTNYETAQYYFPIKVRDEIAHPIATDFEQIALLDPATDRPARQDRWRRMLEGPGGQLDRVVEWGTSAEIDAVTERKYRVVDEVGPVRLWARLAEDR